ncbi:MAG: hypothetical protein A2X81_17145 [Desulfobacterales bacterium GWB2_56_26]|nr:MAG: hypothetical protein A2X81_17145 [Desulfobacterales bacterium GWB2_56_26]
MFWKAISQSTSDPLASSLCCVRVYEMFAREQEVIGQVLSWSAVVEILMMLRGGSTNWIGGSAKAIVGEIVAGR